MEVVKLLLTVPGVDINVNDDQGNSPIINTVKNDSFDIFLSTSVYCSNSRWEYHGWKQTNFRGYSKVRSNLFVQRIVKFFPGTFEFRCKKLEEEQLS